jgi:hypothetical protein
MQDRTNTMAGTTVAGRRVRPRWIVLAAFGSLTVLFTASAGAKPTGEREVVVDQVTWTVSAETCSQIPDGTTIEGTGTRHTDSITRTRRNGTIVVTIEQIAIGTATGSDGHEYQWKYLNTEKVANSTDAPDRYEGTMTDLFELTGGPLAYANGFEAEVVDDLQGTLFEADPVDVDGDPFDFEQSSGRCDPI